MSLPKVTSKIDNKDNTENSVTDVLIEDSPEWLTKDYLQSCLRSYYKDDKLKVTKVHAKPALGKGENYAGVLTRIKINYETLKGKQQSGSYILKSTFMGNEFARAMMEPYDVFNREIEIYEKVMPKLNLLLNEISDEEQIFAKTIKVDKEKSALLFEDLNAREFIMPDRLKGLDKEVTKIVLRKLAKMHACSAVLNERQSHCLEHFDKGLFNRHTDNYKLSYLSCLEACIRRVAQWPEFKQISDKLKALHTRYMELGARVFDPLPLHLNVLAHGDLWTNNILVKYDKSMKKPLDVIIIDFQYAVWSSPAVDLFYFLNTSLNAELDLEDHDELIQYYYYQLRETLEKLQFKGAIPSLHQFLIQLHEKSFYAFHSTCLIQPIQRNTNTEDADINALMLSDERAIRYKDSCYSNPNIQKLLRKLLPVYDKRGLLDVDQ